MAMINHLPKPKSQSSILYYHFVALYKIKIYSHSIVAGGLLVTSYTTLLIPLTSLTILLNTLSNTSYGILAQYYLNFFSSQQKINGTNLFYTIIISLIVIQSYKILRIMILYRIQRRNLSFKCLLISRR